MTSLKKIQAFTLALFVSFVGLPAAAQTPIGCSQPGFICSGIRRPEPGPRDPATTSRILSMILGSQLDYPKSGQRVSVPARDLGECTDGSLSDYTFRQLVLPGAGWGSTLNTRRDSLTPAPWLNRRK